MQKADEKKRNQKGKIASLVGIVVNVLLAVGKMTVGVLFGVMSILADGLNNLMDCGSSVISMISFKLSSKPADKEHPYGHERVEYICSVAVAFVILLVAFETIKGSIEKIVTPTAIDFSVWAIVVLAVSILVKCGLFIYYRTTAKQINSDILKAASQDSLNDCIATSVVLICVILGMTTGINVDGYASIFVALFIAWSGIGILKETFSKLIGQAPEEELIKSGTEELQKLWEPADLSIDFDADSDSYGVGDIVGAYDNITGMTVSAAIIKKIVTIKKGQTTISYKVGE